MAEMPRQFPDVRSGLALEAELMALSETGVCLWSATSPALVCPAAFSLRSSFRAAAVASEKRGWPVAVRPTGGGVVPQGIGVLNLAISVTAGVGFTIEDGYRLITRPIIACLQLEGLRLAPGPIADSFCDGAWNLSVAGQKVVGTAQRWRPMRDGNIRVLAHALILTCGDLVPGVEAVNAFHRDLGLDLQTRADAHTTLQSALGGELIENKGLASALRAAAVRELACVGSCQCDETAACDRGE